MEPPATTAENEEGSSIATTVTKKQRLRSIEKSRTSTCRFADLVAESVIQVYRQLDIPDLEAEEALRGQGSQTCVSAIVMLEQPDCLTVCSIGIGTKIVPEDVAKSDSEGKRVYDSHAEVLARRGFVRFLYAQSRAWRSRLPSIFQTGVFPLQLRNDITFHLYCSSAPCGNACVRRWAKGLSETYAEDIGPFQWPQNPHPRFLVHSPLQVAVLCKVQATRIGETNVTDGEGISSSSKGGVDPLEIPPGTALPGTAQASSRATCSDKVARWCAIGLEGTLFSSLMSVAAGPIRLSTVVAGRKFSRLHMERAICCRLMSFWSKDQPHPASLCTSVKLHEGGYSQEDKAKFTDFALVWALEWDEQGPAEILKPSEGLPILGTNVECSKVSRSALMDLFAKEAKALNLPVAIPDRFSQEAYVELKKSVHPSGRRQNLELLVSKCLKDWPRYRFREVA